MTGARTLGGAEATTDDADAELMGSAACGSTGVVLWAEAGDAWLAAGDTLRLDAADAVIVVAPRNIQPVSTTE